MEIPGVQKQINTRRPSEKSERVKTILINSRYQKEMCCGAAKNRMKRVEERRPERQSQQAALNYSI